jgi:hypothetical protein
VTATRLVTSICLERGLDISFLATDEL